MIEQIEKCRQPLLRLYLSTRSLFCYHSEITKSVGLRITAVKLMREESKSAEVNENSAQNDTLYRDAIYTVEMNKYEGTGERRRRITNRGKLIRLAALARLVDAAV